MDEIERINDLLIEAEEPEEADMDDVLGKFAREQGKFFSVKDGATETFDLIDYVEDVDMKGNPTIAYKISIPGIGEKTWKSGSIRLAGAIGRLPDAGRGHRLKVSRKGTSYDTMYVVELAEVDLGQEPGIGGAI